MKPGLKGAVLPITEEAQRTTDQGQTAAIFKVYIGEIMYGWYYSLAAVPT